MIYFKLQLDLTVLSFREVSIELKLGHIDNY